MRRLGRVCSRVVVRLSLFGLLEFPFECLLYRFLDVVVEIIHILAQVD